MRHDALDPAQPGPAVLPIGRPRDNTRVYVLDEFLAARGAQLSQPDANGSLMLDPGTVDVNGSPT